jgi:hypothetical protein
MKLTVEEQRQLIPDNDVRQAFFRREDIACLPLEEQESRWARHKVSLDKFRGLLSGIEYLGEIP